jgi:hypothetical protein
LLDNTFESRFTALPYSSKAGTIVGVFQAKARYLWYNTTMTPRLTPEMRDAITEHPGQPIYVVDAESQAKYVLIPADTYQKVQALIYDDSEPNPDEFLPLAEEAFRDDWNAPGMDAYDRPDSSKPSS